MHIPLSPPPPPSTRALAGLPHATRQPLYQITMYFFFWGGLSAQGLVERPYAPVACRQPPARGITSIPRLLYLAHIGRGGPDRCGPDHAGKRPPNAHGFVFVFCFFWALWGTLGAWVGTGCTQADAFRNWGLLEGAGGGGHEASIFHHEVFE